LHLKTLGGGEGSMPLTPSIAVARRAAIAVTGIGP
jgi:hypothetical protein